MFSSLVSEARTHYIRLDREGNSLNEILDLFKSTYTDQTNKFDRMKALHALEQHKIQSVDEFAEKFDRIRYWTQETASAYMKDETMIKLSFIKALTNQRLHDVLLSAAEDEEVTFADIRSKAIMLDKDFTEKRPVKSIKEDDKISKLEERIIELEIVLQRSTRPKTKCDYCKKLGHSVDRCYKKKRDVVLKKTGSGKLKAAVAQGPCATAKIHHSGDINQTSVSGPSFEVTVLINNIPIQVLLDTGS